MRPLACALALLTACQGDDVSPADTDTAPPPDRADVWYAPGPSGVGVRSLTLVDDTRMTPANGEEAELSSRTLPVEVWYPASSGTADAPDRDADPAAGPFPVLIFAHGFMSTKSDHAGLGAFLASHGWVFVAPQFPLSTRTAPGGATVADVLNQADDLGFLTDALDAGAGDLSWLGDRADTERLVFGGMSLGGTTALLAGLYGPTRDDRVDAIVAVAPAACMVPASAFEPADTPLLLVHGDADAFVSIAGNAIPAYEAADGPRALVTLAAGTHTGFPDATAELFDGLPNADAAGCGAAGSALQGLDEAALADLLPEGTALLTEECAVPCEGELPTTTMKPSRQGLLLRASARAFLDAVIGADADAGAWLSSGLDVAEADVSVDAAGL